MDKANFFYGKELREKTINFQKDSINEISYLLFKYCEENKLRLLITLMEDNKNKISKDKNLSSNIKKALNITKEARAYECYNYLFKYKAMF